jgi:hypothetical protein
MTEASIIPIFHLPQGTSPQQRLEALEQELARCAGMLDQGDVPSLSGIELEVKVLCDQVLQMPTGEAGEYIQRLQALSDAFSVLGEVMAEQRDALREELTGLQARQKAHRAYGMQSAVSQTDRASNDDAEQE